MSNKNNQQPPTNSTRARVGDSYTPCNKTYTPGGPGRHVNGNYQPVSQQRQPAGSGARPVPPKGGSGVPPATNNKK